MQVYPLLLERQLDDRLWGGRKLAPFFDLPEPHPKRIAESWQVFDTNRVLNGPLAGITLDQATRRFEEQLVGTLSPPRYGVDFPLLAKFIDAHQDLSIQVHPDDEYAHRVEAHTGFHGKHEAWYILDARPGAELFYHLAHPVTRFELEAAVRTNALAPLLNRRPVRAGDIIYVPAGTLHTINAGIMLFEIQQKSDLTYRVYDYGRPRPLHLEKALDVIAYDRPPPADIQPLPLTPDGNRVLLIAAQPFAMERWRLYRESTNETRPTSLDILTLTSGAGEVVWDGGTIDLGRGDSVVLPAALGRYEVIPRKDLTLLRCFIPDLEEDIRKPLRDLGYSQAEIANVVHDNPGPERIDGSSWL
jgi:mannose-6-phosphate isomerase